MSSTEHDDFPTDDDYQSLNAAAVVALVVGLLSPAVLLWPLLVVLPCAAVVLAVIALRGISRAGGAGRGLALIGMAAAMLSLGLGGGYQATFRHRVHAQAAPTAEKLLELISAGQPEDAYLLTLNARERGAAAAYFQSHDPDTDSQADGDKSPASQAQQFAGLPAVQQLATSAPLEGWRLTSRGPVHRISGGRVTLSQTYEVRPAAGPTRPYSIGLERSDAPNLPPLWRVIGVSPADAP